MSNGEGIELRVEPLDPLDSDLGETRLHPTSMRDLDVGDGDPIEIHGSRLDRRKHRDRVPGGSLSVLAEGGGSDQ